MVMDRIVELIPDWLARPIGVVSGLAGFTGAGLVLMATAYGEYLWAFWAVAAFSLAGFLWHVSDHLSIGS